MEYHRRITYSYPHPEASAIFDAYYDGSGELENWRTTRTHGGGGEVAASAASSAAVTLDIVAHASLGWRTRYSSLELHPMSIRPIEGRRLTKRRPRTEGEDDIELATTFHVRQVFPRDRHGKLFSVFQPSDNVDYGLDNDNPSDIEDQVNYIDDCEQTCVTIVNYLDEMALAHGTNQINALSGKVGSSLIGADVIVCADGCGPFADLAERNSTAISHVGCCVDDDDDEEKKPRFAVDDGTVDERRMHHHLHHHHRQQSSGRASKMFVCGEEMELTDNVYLLQHTDVTNKRMNIQSDARIRRSRQQFDNILGVDCVVPKLYPMDSSVNAIDELHIIQPWNSVVLPALNVWDIAPHHDMYPMYPAVKILIQTL